jgi:hypothetical protein
MTNGSTTPATNKRGGLSPFGEDDPGDTRDSRLPGILAGAEKQLAEAAVHMLLVGGGVLFSGTKDGGAVAVHVFWGRSKWTRYAASPEALQALLDAISGWTPVSGSEIALVPRNGAQARR